MPLLTCAIQHGVHILWEGIGLEKSLRAHCFSQSPSLFPLHMKASSVRPTTLLCCCHCCCSSSSSSFPFHPDRSSSHHPAFPFLLLNCFSLRTFMLHTQDVWCCVPVPDFRVFSDSTANFQFCSILFAQSHSYVLYVM